MRPCRRVHRSPARSVGLRRVSDSDLSLDRGIVMAAIGNALAKDLLRRAFADRQVTLDLQPLPAMEEPGTRPRDGVAELGLPWARP